MTKKREIINPEKLFKAEGFTHTVSAVGGKTIYIAGQLPWDENFQLIGQDDLEAQTKKSLENIQHVLDEAGANWDNVVKLVIYTTKPQENERIDKVKMIILDGIASPAVTLIGVAALADPRCFIEIEAVAVI